MSSSSAYTLQLPYLGSIPLGRSPPSLASFQKPLRELYTLYYRQKRDRNPDERRIIISDRDILIFEPDAASKGKRALIYSTLESIVDVQALEFYFLANQQENNYHHHHKRARAAFLPIGCEQQERFRSLYSTIDKSQYNLLSVPNSSTFNHPPLVLFVIRKAGTDATSSLLDCHVFAVHRESVAFELCDMIRKLIIKRTMSPLLPGSSTSGTTLLRVHENEKHQSVGMRTKYLDRDRPISAMQHRSAEILHAPEKRKNRPLSNVNLQELAQSYPNGLTNPLTSSSILFQEIQQSNSDTNKVLAMDSDHHQRVGSPSNSSIPTLSTKHRQQSQQRHFIKASTSSSSSLIFDESDEVVNDLMNIVVAEKLKTNENHSNQVPVKRHASFDQTSLSNGQQEHSTTKKRYQFHHHHKKRSLLMSTNPLPTIPSANNTPVMSRTATNSDENQPLSPIDNHFPRPQFILNRYGDIGNYVPKLLRENVTATSNALRSSDSNENIFFRATTGNILNGFLNLDFNSSSNTNNNNNNQHSREHYRSSPCLNDDQTDRTVFSLVRQLHKNQIKTFTNEKQTLMIDQISNFENNPESSMTSYHIPRVSLSVKPPITAMGGVKVLPVSPLQISSSSSSSKNPLKTTSSGKPRRVASFTVIDTELPVDYRQFLRHTNQGDRLYGEEPQEKQNQSNLERCLGYLP